MHITTLALKVTAIYPITMVHWQQTMPHTFMEFREDTLILLVPTGFPEQGSNHPMPTSTLAPVICLTAMVHSAIPKHLIPMGKLRQMFLTTMVLLIPTHLIIMEIQVPQILFTPTLFQLIAL
jgi:hypothetical protein